MADGKLIETSEVKYGVESVNVIPTKETVDYNRLYKFTDLSMFKLFPNDINRAIRESTVNKFRKKMKNKKFHSDCTNLLVDISTLCIMDGQNKWEAYKREQTENGYSEPIYVRFIDGPQQVDEMQKTIQDIQEGTSWNDKDHINVNMNKDNDLKKLKEFCLKYPKLHRETKRGKNKGKKEPFFRRGAAIVTGDKSYYLKAMKDGTFKASKEDWDEAPTVYKEVEGILTATRLANQTDIPSFEGIINGWYAVRNDKKMSQKISMLPNGIDTLYKYMTPDIMDVRHTTSSDIWRTRFKAAVENAYKYNC